MALLITTGGRYSTGLGALLLARSLDNTVGCAVALAAFRLIVPTGVTTWLPTAIADTLDAVDRTSACLSPAAITTPAAGVAHDLQRSALRLTETFDNAVNGSTGQRKAAEQTWPAATATQAPDSDGGAGSASELAELHRSLRAMATAVRAGREPPPVGAVPASCRAKCTTSGTPWPASRRPPEYLNVQVRCGAMKAQRFSDQELP